MRWSIPGDTGWSGSVHSVMIPSPVVSMTAGHQPWDASASWVSSHRSMSIHPMAPFCPKYRKLSSLIWLWSALKQVSICSNSPVAGS